MPRSIITLFNCLSLAFAATAASAAPISWTVGDIDGGSGVGDLSVSTNGTLIEAANFGGDGVPSPVINTVTFTGIDFVAPGTGSPTNLVGLSYENSQSGNGASGIGAIDVLLDTIGFDSGVNVQTADLTGLVPDRIYEVQFFLSHTPTAARTQEIDDGEGNSIIMKNADPSQFVTGIFTADAATQSLTFDNLNPGSQLLSGYQLRDLTPPPPAVPEPTTIFIATLGLLGMCWLGRRRRKRA